MLPPSSPRTVRLRIAVVLDRDGNWTAAGSSLCDTEEKFQRFARARLGEITLVITADVPVPVREEPAVIEGRVSDAE